MANQLGHGLIGYGGVDVLTSALERLGAPWSALAAPWLAVPVVVLVYAVAIESGQVRRNPQRWVRLDSAEDTGHALVGAMLAGWFAWSLLAFWAVALTFGAALRWRAR